MSGERELYSPKSKLYQNERGINVPKFLNVSKSEIPLFYFYHIHFFEKLSLDMA